MATVDSLHGGAPAGGLEAAEQPAPMPDGGYIVRRARIADVKAMHKLLMDCARRSLLLPRPLNNLYSHLRDFQVVTAGPEGPVVGCCALAIAWEDLAEIRSLVVDPAHQKRGVGRMLVESCLSWSDASPDRVAALCSWSSWEPQ